MKEKGKEEEERKGSLSLSFKVASDACHRREATSK